MSDKSANPFKLFLHDKTENGTLALISLLNNIVFIMGTKLNKYLNKKNKK